MFVRLMFFLLSYRRVAALAPSTRKRIGRNMDQESICNRVGVTELLVEAVRRSGRSRRGVARHAGIDKDSFQRILSGQREPTIGQTLRVLDTAGLDPELTLVLTLLAGEQTAIEWMDSAALGFLGELYCQVPKEVCAQLGERMAEIRPRWGVGAAKLVARMVVEHADDLARREVAFGSDILGRGPTSRQ